MDTNKNTTFHAGSGLHSGSQAAMAAAVSSPTTTFLGQYPALFDPTRTSHLDWHLHAASFHNAQGKAQTMIIVFVRNVQETKSP